MRKERHNNYVDMSKPVSDVLSPVQEGYAADSSYGHCYAQQVIGSPKFLQVEEQVGFDETPAIAEDEEKEDEDDHMRKFEKSQQILHDIISGNFGSKRHHEDCQHGNTQQDVV